MSRVDSHQHFWRYSEKEYPWMQADWPIRRDFFPEHLQPELENCGLDACVAVQARQTLEETCWLLELADQSPIIQGVVGWVDLRSPQIGDQIAQFASYPKLVGVRHVVQDEPDDAFMQRPDFQRGIAALAEYGLTYDILVFPRQLRSAVKLVRQFPKQPFVLDHLAKPHIRDGQISPWREAIRELASLPNVMCKVSGLVTEARWNRWRPDDFTPFLDVAMETFGEDRLMYGSDWPVALLAGTYSQVFNLAQDYFSQLGCEAEAKIFGRNAVRFYDL